MTASTGSAYPPSVADLVPRVRQWAAELGRMPSRNQVMREFKVGGPKATAVLDALAVPGVEIPIESDGESTVPDTTDPKPVRVLHSVPTPDLDEAADMPATDPGPTRGEERPAVAESGEVTPVADPDTAPVAQSDDNEHSTAELSPSPVMPAESGAAPARPGLARRVRRWPLVLLAAGAFVSIWGGWVGLGRMTGFGPIQLLPGIWDELVINSAITLPIGVEAYAALAMSVWLSSQTRSDRTRRFARWSALGSLALGMAGQVAYHHMSSAGITVAPWWITTFVACLPVLVLGFGAALLHMIRGEENR